MSQIPRIYQAQTIQMDRELVLDDHAVRHGIRVLRLRTGDALTLFNGQGGEYHARLSVCEGRHARAEILSFSDPDRESPLTIHLAQVIARGERMDQIIQKAVELGVTRITPLYSQRCGIRLNQERALKRWQHWQGIIISACEQCGRNRIPHLDACTHIEDWLASTDHEASVRITLNPHAAQSLSALPATKDHIILLIGPEGGLNSAEMACASQAGFLNIRLGPRILRTETAGMAAITSIQCLWGDFQVSH